MASQSGLQPAMVNDGWAERPIAGHEQPWPARAVLPVLQACGVSCAWTHTDFVLAGARVGYQNCFPYHNCDEILSASLIHITNFLLQILPRGCTKYDPP